MFNIFQKLLKIVLNKDIGYDYDEDWLYNQIIIKKLKADGKLRSPDIIAAFESINKSWFMPSRDEEDTFIDVDYKSDISSELSIHLFSPYIYATILENLDLQKGHSFLNVGSGTGYLSSIVGCLIGYKGKNIGLEIHSKLLDFALTLISKLKKTLKYKQWCSPEFQCINIFDYKTNEKFDRIFVGASIKEYQRTYICRMLKPFGIAIVACGNKLQKIYNIGGDQYIVEYIQKVEFSNIQILEKMPVKTFHSSLKISDDQKSLTIANYANFKNLTGLIYTFFFSFVLSLSLSNSFFYFFILGLFLCYFSKDCLDSTKDLVLFRPLHILISVIQNFIEQFYHRNFYRTMHFETFYYLIFSIFIAVLIPLFLNKFPFLNILGLLFGALTFLVFQKQKFSINFREHPSPFFMLILSFQKFRVKHLIGFGFGQILGIYCATVILNSSMLSLIFLGIPFAAIFGFIFGILFVIFNYFSFIYGFKFAFVFLSTFQPSFYIFNFILSLFILVVFSFSFLLAINKFYKRMKNIVGELCQNFEPNISIDTVNGFACFYEFPEQANIKIKGVIEKYKMKKESEKSRKLQEKEAEALQRKIEEEKTAQLKAEKEIKMVATKIEEQNQEMKEMIRKQRMSLDEKIQEAKKLHKIENDNCYNFAFAGHTKTGKSSLINAIRGINDKDIGAAKVGITETTQKIQKYVYQNISDKNAAINFYDIPGSGTLSHDANQYYHEKGLCAFDCLFILIQETFCEEEINFAIEALKHKQKVAFIQSKCDILLTNLKKQKRIKEIDQAAVNECLMELKKNHISEIQKSSISQLQKIPCFYVSSLNLHDLKNGVKSDPNVSYNEKELLEFMMSEIKFSRNSVS